MSQAMSDERLRHLRETAEWKLQHIHTFQDRQEAELELELIAEVERLRADVLTEENHVACCNEHARQAAAERQAKIVAWLRKEYGDDGMTMSLATAIEAGAALEDDKETE